MSVEVNCGGGRAFGSLDGYRTGGGEWPTDQTAGAESGEEHVKQLHIGEGRVGVVNEEFLVTVSLFLTHHVGRGLCFVLTCSI